MVKADNSILTDQTKEMLSRWGEAHDKKDVPLQSAYVTGVPWKENLTHLLWCKTFMMQLCKMTCTVSFWNCAFLSTYRLPVLNPLLLSIFFSEYSWHCQKILKIVVLLWPREVERWSNLFTTTFLWVTRSCCTNATQKLIDRKVQQRPNNLKYLLNWIGFDTTCSGRDRCWEGESQPCHCQDCSSF